MVHMKNSSDLSSGRRPKSKSDEFFMCTMFWLLRYGHLNFLLFPKKVSSISEHDPVTFSILKF